MNRLQAEHIAIKINNATYKATCNIKTFADDLMSLDEKTDVLEPAVPYKPERVVYPTNPGEFEKQTIYPNMLSCLSDLDSLKVVTQTIRDVDSFRFTTGAKDLDLAPQELRQLGHELIELSETLLD